MQPTSKPTKLTKPPSPLPSLAAKAMSRAVVDADSVAANTGDAKLNPPSKNQHIILSLLEVCSMVILIECAIASAMYYYYDRFNEVAAPLSQSISRGNTAAV